MTGVRVSSDTVEILILLLLLLYLVNVMLCQQRLSVSFQNSALYLRNRKRVACVYSVIMHAGNVRRIREKRVKHEA